MSQGYDTSSLTKSREDRYSTGVYYKRSIAIVRGQGAHVWDERGNRYIDCVGGQGAANIGHCNEPVVRAIEEQARKLISCTELFYNDRRAELLEKLSNITPDLITRFFLCNSGTEANEGALKFARLATGRTEIIAAMQGYHGKTMGSLSATWNKDYRKPFEPLVPGFKHVPFNDLEKMREAISDKTAAVIIEVVQGESGVRVASGQYLKGLEILCKEKGALLIVDEVQTGFARTGKMFAIDHYGIQPDIITMAKSIAGGIPMGAIGITKAVADKLFKLAHTSTFGGNPLACAAACATIDYIQEKNLAERAAELGEYFLSRLHSIESDRIREVRGLGLMIGVELKTRSGPYIQELMARGVLALAAGPTVIRFLPPLVIEKADITTVVEKTAEVLSLDL